MAEATADSYQGSSSSLPRLKSSPLMNRMLPQEDADMLYATRTDVPRSFRDGCPACGKNRGRGVDGIIEIPEGTCICNCRDQLQRYKWYMSSGIPKTYCFLGWGDFHGDDGAFRSAKRYVENLPRNIDEGMGILFHGGFGTGKTMLASLIGKAAIRAGHQVMMTTFKDMVDDTKAGWSDREYEAWYRAKVESCRLLILDDMGREQMDTSTFDNSFARRMFDSLLRTRTQFGRTTIVTTNMDSRSIVSMYGTAVASLISERMTIINVGGADYRPKAKMPQIGHRMVR